MSNSREEFRTVLAASFAFAIVFLYVVWVWLSNIFSTPNAPTATPPERAAQASPRT